MARLNNDGISIPLKCAFRRFVIARIFQCMEMNIYANASLIVVATLSTIIQILSSVQLYAGAKMIVSPRVPSDTPSDRYIPDTQLKRQIRNSRGKARFFKRLHQLHAGTTCLEQIQPRITLPLQYFRHAANAGLAPSVPVPLRFLMTNS